ncbi:putative bifunctional diguanylate cyclase/phosphodiesterase [Aureimonas pseudogalii]|uniref:Diguanylate cyclase (GGDEF)-like protein n=1 Tax=Aureimonas pseudogalii TaxID=1744844 RepID=A0A7W6ML19_9HYPH|nr:EAL domain-containing protein [Aureimonas pseudogalii]MBB3999389.1 diguanylate cyclase (GGDEF)-like protein [Aureimonas pseudogalii]
MTFWTKLTGRAIATKSDAASDRLVSCQVIELRKQIPLLYSLLVINAAAIVFTHLSSVPFWLGPGAVMVLSVVCLIRGLQWSAVRPEQFTPAQSRTQLRRTTRLGVGISVVFLAWALALGQYGGPYEKAHVANFIAVTVVGCIFCLMHLPSAARWVVLAVSGPLLVYYISSGEPVLIAIAFNITFVMIVMVRVVENNFQGFVQLIESRSALADKQDETQRLMEENRHLAFTDSLTLLPNRRFFFQSLEETLEARGETGEPFALAILDLDRFKPINDTHGHLVGDRVLVETGRRLAAFVGEGVLAVRLGGDEFGLLILDATSSEAVAQLCRSLCEALAAPIDCGETVVAPGCSAGVAFYPAAGRTAAALFDRADYALYHSKEKARGAVTLFSQDHEDAIRSERSVETALQISDLEREMEVHFQPICDLQTDRIVMLEALARWTNPLLGRIPPDRFIAAAERCGLIHRLTLLLLRKALADIRRLPADIGLSFNLSSHDLTSPETVLAIMSAVRNSGIEPGRITLELTETALMRDFDLAQRSIEVLRALGMRIALDDFGTGYSSLGYVHRLALDKIKIDRSFMADIDARSGRSIVATVLDLSQNLSLDCIAEGVETEAQLATLRRLGCRFAQGYLIGRPEPIAALEGRWPAANAATG